MMSPEHPSNKIGKSVGEKLRAARIAQHYTQSQLAAPDFSVSYISAIERGQIHPSLRALEILATRLGLTSTQLLPNRSLSSDHPGTKDGQTEQNKEDVTFYLLTSHLAIMQEQPDRALIILQDIDESQLNQRHRLEFFHLQGWAYYKLNQYQEAEYFLNKADNLARDANNAYFQRHITNLIGNTHAAMRNHAQAVQSYEKCLHLLAEQEASDPFLLMQTYTSLGQQYRHLDNLELSLTAFHKALTIANSLTTSKHVQSVYARLCEYYAHSDDSYLANLYAYKSIQVQHQQNTKLLRSEIYHNLGRSILQTHPEQMNFFLHTARQKLQSQQDPLTQASILTREAEWQFTQNLFQSAKDSALQALQLADPFGDTVIKAEALLILARIEYTHQQNEEGNTHFVSGLDMLERLNYHEELADESIKYAQLLEDIGEEHKAFTYVRRAFQSKQKMGR
jgi:transcriptional regulator with XRE-family HTH domain